MVDRRFWINHLKRGYDSYQGVWLSDKDCRDLVKLLEETKDNDTNERVK